MLPAWVSSYHLSLAVSALSAVALTSAWAMFSGPTRYLSLATAAFFGVGAYSAFVLPPDLPWPGVVTAGAIFSAALAVGVGVVSLRLRGPYFAIVTFGLSQLVQEVGVWYERHVTGTVGRILMAPWNLPVVYYSLLAIALVAVGLRWWLERSRWGVVLRAIGCDEERTEVLGIPVSRVKVAVFVLSAALMGAVGAAQAARWTYLDPGIAFNPLLSFQTVVMALLGGAHSLWGPVVGALVLSGVSEALLVRFRYLYLLGFGVLLVVVVRYFPHGLAGWYLETETSRRVRRWWWSLSRRTAWGGRMRQEFRLYVDGTWETAPGGRTFPDVNPATGQVFARVAAGDREVCRRAVEAAARSQREWAELSPGDRASVLLRAAQVWERRQEELVRMLVTETGSVWKKARFEVAYCSELLRHAASLAYQAGGQVVPSNIPGKLNYLVRRPVGVVSVITPWNVPYLLTLRAVGPALALGNAVVVKPSEETPLCGGLILAEVFEEAGLPQGLLNVVPCPREGVEEVGEVLVTHPAVGAVSFTGSTATGRKLAALAGRHLKRIVLELGGKNPLIVLSDADLDLAVRVACFGAFFHQGQICMATSRVLVEESVAETFTTQLVERARRLEWGDPRDPRTDIGPIINGNQLAKIEAHVEDAVAKGARVLVGGHRRDPFFEPTVLGDVTPAMRCYHEETFGPVVSVIPIRDAREAVRIANDSTYGLSAAVVTADAERAMALASRLQCGMVHVNDATVHDEPHIPFGGVKGSGLGRHGGLAALEAFTEIHWISVQTEPRRYPFDP